MQPYEMEGAFIGILRLVEMESFVELRWKALLSEIIRVIFKANHKMLIYLHSCVYHGF